MSSNKDGQSTRLHLLMLTTSVRTSIENNAVEQEKAEAIDLEAHNLTNLGPATEHCIPSIPQQTSRHRTLIHRLLRYPPQGTLKLRPTSWLDGLRGIAALEVYLFHTMGLWTTLYPAFYSTLSQNNPLQFPLIRTLFVSGPAAVPLFFAISGYVLTQSSLSSIRDRCPGQVYHSVFSSMFRRGFRLYMPPVFLTFWEMVASRFGVGPPLNFTFVPETSFFAQVLDWVKETNRFVNPGFNFSRAARGVTTYSKYDAVIWTIPLEFYGSFVCYFLLLSLAPVSSYRARMSVVAGFAVLCMICGSWNFSCFAAGMLVADFNLHQESLNNIPGKHGIFWTILFVLAFYVAGLPTFALGNAENKPMPGFEIIRALTPSWLSLDDHARFMWSLSGISLLLSISQLWRLKAVFETRFCQYLGKISFSLYLAHEFCIVLFGIRIKTFLLQFAGGEQNAHRLVYCSVCGVWYGLFTFFMFMVAAQGEKWVDRPSVRFAKWLEEKCIKRYLF